MASSVKATPATTRTFWICSECGQPIRPGEGYLEFSNLDSEAGRVGAMPRQPSPGIELPHPSEGVVQFTWSEMVKLQPKMTVGLQVVHARCDQNPESGYWIDVGRVDSPKNMLELIFHLNGKAWFGPEELRSLKQLWQEYGPATCRHP